MTPSELKAKYEETQTPGLFFTRNNMKFAGDTMKNYGCCDGGKVDTWTREGVEVWEIYRKRPVKHGLGKSAFFCKKTFERILPKN